MTPEAEAWAKARLASAKATVEYDPDGKSRIAQVARWEVEIYEAAIRSGKLISNVTG